MLVIRLLAVQNLVNNMDNPRLVAIKALRRTRQENAFSNLVLDAVLEESDLSAADRAFAAALYYGVLERSKTLDYMIEKLCVSGAKKIAPLVMECLRLGLYQIKFMDKIPQSAAVNETVKIVKKKCSGATGFVNALLRRAAREDISLPEGKDAKSLSVRFSCDESIAARLIKDYGEDTAEGFLASSLNPAPVYIRVNTLKTTTDELVNRFKVMGYNCQKCSIPEALKLDNIGNVEKNPLFKEGLFHVEDLAAQWAVKALAPKAGERVLDMCAAPGGKSFSAAQYMSDNGSLMAFDLYENRVGLIKKGAERLGITCISAFAADSTVYDPSLGEFDRVLCDAPCSGIGIIRRKPDIKYKSCEDFGELPEIQTKLLETAAKYVRSGGVLVYSTCTLCRDENDGVADKFLESHPDFSPFKVEIAGERTSRKTFFPMTDETDGFYIAVFKKE